MGLYLIQHTHAPEKCPIQSPDLVQQLAQHVTETNAKKLGVKILADWVNDEDHHVVLVLEAPDQRTAAKFAEPFATIGSVTINEGVTCAEMAERCLSH